MTKVKLVVPYKGIRPLAKAIKLAQIACNDMGLTMSDYRITTKCGRIIVEEK